MKNKYPGARLLRSSNIWNSCHRPRQSAFRRSKDTEGDHLSNCEWGKNRLILFSASPFSKQQFGVIWCKGKPQETSTGARNTRTGRELQDPLLGESLSFYQQGGKSPERGYLPKSHWKLLLIQSFGLHHCIHVLRKAPGDPVQQEAVQYSGEPSSVALSHYSTALSPSFLIHRKGKGVTNNSYPWLLKLTSKFRKG